MKRLALAFACLISVAFFASCENTVEHPEPSIAILAEEGYVTDSAIINLGEEINYGFVLAANNETNKDLKSLVIMCGEQTIVDTTITGKDFTYRGILSFEAKAIIGTAVIEAIVTDVDGQTATANITLLINENPLFVAPYTWVRRGANLLDGAEEAMAALGLEWGGSYKEIFATWKPMEGYRLYKFDANWDEIVYESNKVALFADALENGEPIENFREITTAHSDNYGVVLGTILVDEARDPEMHLIYVDRAEIETGGFGTQITVTGEVK